MARGKTASVEPAGPADVRARVDELGELWPLVLAAYKRALTDKNIAIRQRAADAVASRLGVGPVSGLAIQHWKSGQDPIESMSDEELDAEIERRSRRISELRQAKVSPPKEAVIDVTPIRQSTPRGEAPAPAPAARDRDREQNPLLAQARKLLGGCLLDEGPQGQENPKVPEQNPAP